MEAHSMETMKPMPIEIVAVTDELGQGQGGVTAKNRVNDEQEAWRIAEEAQEYLKQVALGVPGGCIDGRCVLRTIDGGESELGPKTAGGAAISGLYAMEINEMFEDDQSILQHFARVVDMLEENGEVPARFHIDADHEEEVASTLAHWREELKEIETIEEFIQAVEESDIKDGTGCGMGDQLKGAYSALARLPRTYKDSEGQVVTETDQQIKERLEFMKSITAAIEGDDFDEELFSKNVEIATQQIQSGHLDTFNEMKALIIADRVLRDRGLEGGIDSRLEVLETSEEGVHGHVEEFIYVTKKPGFVFDLTNYFRTTKRSAFSYEQWVAKHIANATVLAAEESAIAIKALTQGVTTANVGAAFQLADGSQRAAIFA